MSLFPLGLIGQGGGAGGGGANALELITTVFGTGSSGTISFSSIPQTYKHLQIRATVLTTANNYASLRITMNGGGTYYSHRLIGSGGSMSTSSNSNVSNIHIFGEQSYLDGNPTASIVNIWDYTSAKNKTVQAFSGQPTSSYGIREVSLNSGLLVSTSAVSSISISASAGSFASQSRFSLYGVKGA